MLFNGYDYTSEASSADATPILERSWRRDALRPTAAYWPPFRKLRNLQAAADLAGQHV